MIDDLDEALRQLLIKEIPISNGEVDIEFKQPTREWSARISRPTINAFLFDVRENVKLRQAEPAWEVTRGNGGGMRRVNPVRLDCHYLITCWATEPDDEHRLLARTLMALFRNLVMPNEVLPASLQTQPKPIAIQVGQYDTLENPNDFWSVMDNQQRPGIVCIATMALDPYQPLVSPLVRTVETRYVQAADASRGEADEAAGDKTFLQITGVVRSEKPLDNLRITVVGRALDVRVRPEGQFMIRNIQPGDYTLEIEAQGQPPQRHKITVPAPNYDVDLT
jgi:Pvc16 N-terminal domain/Carboxypeptidase regulatory-like domain